MVDREYCTGCGACAAACPRDAVRMTEDRDGFLYPVIRKNACTDCGLCTRVCPVNGEFHFSGENACFGAKAKQARVRQSGSSGGMFPLLAAQVLKEGGSVWGAAFGEDGVLRHIAIRDEAGISRITRTKYIQSDMSQVWQGMRQAVKTGLPVLFCGTPCQADAVRSFLGEERGGLILVDLICYGVPSPGVWRRYAAYLSRRCGGELEDFSFRDKRNRDHGHTCAVRAGGREHVWPLSGDPYCQSYFCGVNLRPSCFHCRYCTPDRGSDITLGDFWGLDRPGFDDGMGVSAVICHTDAGKRLWERVRDEAEWFACGEAEIANDRQPRLREPVKARPGRRLYLALLRVLPFPLWMKLLRRI